MSRRNRIVLTAIACMVVAHGVSYANRDEFDTNTLEDAWTWDNPGNDSDFDLVQQEGWLKITCAPGEHDIWDTRGDGPAMLIEAPDDYTFETHYTTTVGGNISVGLVFLSEDAIGDAGLPAPWAALFTQTGGRLDWQHAPGVDVSQAAVATSEDVYVRVDKAGDAWTVFYKEQEGDDWEMILEDTYDIGGAHSAGLMAKNWGGGAEISGFYEYVEASWDFATMPVESAGKLAGVWGRMKQR
jgi:hypothetical protein